MENNEISSKDGLAWSFFQQWNQAIIKPQRPYQQRDYIWASELGGAYVDRFLKMQGEQATNPPNKRSLRKFQAGHFWERNVRTILAFAGLHQASEEYLTYKYPDLLEVTGRADFVAGGQPDWNKARQLVKEYSLMGDDEVELGDEDLFIRIIDNFEASLGNKLLKTIILELKSSSSYMFERYVKTGKPNPHHVLQTYHYLKSSGIDEGHIVYICKDDCRMIEFGVFLDDSPVEDIYRNDIEQMTLFKRSGEMPPKEPEIVFEDDTGRFSKNWKIEYSQYLTKVYGYSEPESYYNLWGKKAAQWNRVLTRVIDDKKMTDANLKIIEEIKAYFPNFDQLVNIAKQAREEKNGKG